LLTWIDASAKTTATPISVACITQKGSHRRPRRSGVEFPDPYAVPLVIDVARN
jgi:hypothetical protein